MEWHFQDRLSIRFSWLDEKISLPLREKWSITLPCGILSQPIFADGAIYVACVEALYKLSAIEGVILWKISKEAGKPLRSLQHSPSYYDGRIYYSTGLTNNLYCVDAETGEKLWQISRDAQGESPCFYQDHIYLKSVKLIEKDYVFGYSKYTLDMEEIWFHPCEGRINIDTCAIDEDCLVYSDTQGNVYGLNTDTGKELWRMNIINWISQPQREGSLPENRDIPYVSEVPVIVGDIVVVTAKSPGQTFGLDIKSGKVLWFHKADEDEKWMYRGQGFDNNHWYCFTMDRLKPKHYFGIDIKTGKVEMKADISAYKDQIGDVMAKTGLVVGNYHFIGVYEPPRIIAFDTGTGELVWTHPIDKSKLRGDSRGIYADGKLIWVRNTGDVYCFE